MSSGLEVTGDGKPALKFSFQMQFLSAVHHHGPKPLADSCASASMAGACWQPRTKPLSPARSAKQVSAVVWNLTTAGFQGPYLQKQEPQGLGS